MAYFFKYHTLTSKKAGAILSRKFLFITTLFVLIFLAGCTTKEVRVPLEDVGMVGIVGFDYIDENTMKLSIAIPQYSPQAQNNTEVFSITTDLASKGIMDIEALSDKKITFNQLRVILIDEEFARKGNLQKTMRHLYRNPQAADKVLIAIVQGGTSEELIKANYPDKPNINFYLNDLLKPTIHTAFNPNTNIHDFIYTLTNPVFDPIMPVVAKKEEKIEVTSVALFKNKNMFETITAEKAVFIQDLQGKNKIASLALEINQGHGTEKLVFNVVKSNVKIKSNKSIDSPKLTISLTYKGTLVEYRGSRGSNLNSSTGLAKIEKDIDKHLKNEVTQFLEKLKEQKIDPIGLSEHFRKDYQGEWTREMTEAIMSKLQVDVEVEMSIISTGTLD